MKASIGSNLNPKHIMMTFVGSVGNIKNIGLGFECS
jgi:hypothetical protein